MILRIDTDEGISLDICADVARKLGPWLDEEALFDFDYGLEVSSPGASEPLQVTRQYPQHVGRELQVQLVSGHQLLGKLEAVHESSIYLRERAKSKPVKGRPIKYAGEHTDIPFDHIQQAVVYIK